MITPSHLSPSFCSATHLMLERSFDDAIRVAHQTGMWPARPRHLLISVSPGALSAIAHQYRQFWRVTPGDDTCYVEISKP